MCLLIQHELKLLMINLRYLAIELFYQLAVKQFGIYAVVKLDSAISIYDYVYAYLTKHSVQTSEELGTYPPSWHQRCCDLVIALVQHKDMLEEYFSLSISLSSVDAMNEDEEINVKKVMLTSLPALLHDNCTPDPLFLPVLLFELCECAEEGVWKTEKDCFVSICECLANYFACSLLDGFNSRTSSGSVEDPVTKISFVLLPALRYYFFPCKYPRSRVLNTCSSQNNQNIVVEVTSLNQLYKVFERC